MADSPTFYSNFAEVRAAFYDVTMTFHRVVDVPVIDGELKPVPEKQAVVQMSPQHAKAFFEALKANLEKYEKRFGAIPTPPTAEAGPVSAG